MDLENFISLSLVQIAKGIEKANTELSNSSALVSPKGTSDVQKNNIYGSLKLKDESWVKVHTINFDVALTATEGGETKGGLGISVGAVSIGATAKDDFQNSSVSRIQFGIPMVLPQEDK